VIGALARYGDGLGIAFQMADDLLDWGGASGQIGKNTGDDFRERKLTLPVIRAVATADAAERAFWVRTIEKGDQGDGDLDHAMEILRRHGTLEQTREEAHRHAADARAALADVPSHDLDRHDGGPGRLRGGAPDLIAARRRLRQDGRGLDPPVGRNGPQRSPRRGRRRSAR
jgi:geranylgeranyl pyrophosphate synthase